MGYQSEAELELQFIDQLNKQGYSTVFIPDYDTLVELSLIHILLIDHAWGWEPCTIADIAAPDRNRHCYFPVYTL